ncbi:serine protein kinase RIO [Nocardioides sp. Root140]|uniref:serine protein kinase RIO n=1 Tax=Nocardioides sp. Root140 TaxID=1736460 RepID=UPI0006FF3727|nr:RIO1 family regulatory kinase/ATPase [Nocardioides sp. Root140]KQY63848.1 serine/threonine protein kinase [Nocardioides sp. Root140]
MMHDFAGPHSDPASHDSTPHDNRLDGIDSTFVFEFEQLDEPDDANQRWSTWLSVEPLCRGPKPRPDWVVTSQGAIDTELGILKTGKEAEVFLVERGVPGGESVVMAAKRYKSREHAAFHRSGAYTEGWSTRRSRDARAIKAKSTFGREVASGQWANSEWTALKRFWEAGVPVPYPVQIDGTEILMEFISVDDSPAPRLAQTRPAPDLLEHYFEQLRSAMEALARDGVAHGDLSPYNILAAGERLVIIDLPQAVDIVGNAQGMDFLMRDCANVCAWFRRRGLEVDEHELFGELLAQVF